MVPFIDLRATPHGGFVADKVSLVGCDDFAAYIRGRRLVIVTHGFNVNARSGTASIEKWATLAQLDSDCAYVGLLWPGDSAFLPILDYPVEEGVARQAGRLLAGFLDVVARDAATISFVSHSLGARVILETVAYMAAPVEHVVLMAGAIESDCLSREYANAYAKARKVAVVASLEDWVLKFAFPIGNPVGEIIMVGHPYFKGALGRFGPENLLELGGRCELWPIPDTWNYGHLDYMPGSANSTPVTGKLKPPRQGDSDFSNGSGDDHWKPAWSAAVIRAAIET